jgi:hypothetical protein
MKIIITESQYKRLVNEQTTPIKQVEPSFFEKMVTNFLVPIVGGPIGGVASTVYNKYAGEGRKIYNDFAAIVNRRIEYNKKNNLPLDKMSQEEISYRNRLLKATPSFGYPNPLEFIKVISDIQSGKDIRKDEIENSKMIQRNNAEVGLGRTRSVDDINQTYSSREELKKMWLGIDDANGLKTGEWIQSTFKPRDSKDSKAIYYMPKTLPIFTQKEFDLAYNEILKTKKPDGTFPGGNSSTVLTSKTLPEEVKKKLRSQLGNFKLGASQDNKGKYISFYDEWDLFPPALTKMGYNIQQFGKTPLIYYRVYRP